MAYSAGPLFFAPLAGAPGPLGIHLPHHGRPMLSRQVAAPGGCGTSAGWGLFDPALGPYQSNPSWVAEKNQGPHPRSFHSM